MRSHEEAVKRIGRYLKATADIGLVLKPNGSNRLTASADADFAGSWNFKNSDEASSVLSRSGYLIMFSNCPILWVSKMQSEIALSTTEAEYICLSQCIRDLIPIRTIIKELAPILNMEISNSIIKSTVFEDNKGAIELANEPKYRPRTKHIGLKWHHFREHVKNGTVKVKYIDTKEQLADCLTKPLPRPQYVQLRYGIMGW